MNIQKYLIITPNYYPKAKMKFPKYIPDDMKKIYYYIELYFSHESHINQMIIKLLFSLGVFVGGLQGACVLTV